MIHYPRIIAHRCGGVLAPENSLAGLGVAAQLGCKAVEFDAMLTADRVPILMHDETLERTTRCTGRVAEMTFAQIRACDVAVPTLEEAIADCHRLGLWANIELKPAMGHEEETGTVVGRWLADHWNGQGVISSFSEKSALAGRRELPDVPFAMLCKALPDDWLSRCQRLGAGAVHLAGHSVMPAQATAMNDACIPWATYTVNVRAEADRLFALGASAIFTDRPDLWIIFPKG
ncbi:MAG: glycerophosphodiester phosphodiesterase family protein [Rhodocyclaceae bacterium]|nr:glycerophosphodiester phosphodiesterase family protein [Rhodocyclaceae bacterium]